MNRFNWLFLVMILFFGLSMPAFAVDTRGTGLIFANFNYNISNYPDWDDRSDKNDFAEFELTRAYLGVQASFNEQWSAYVAGDIEREDQIEVTPVYDDEGNLIDVTVSQGKGIYNYFTKYAWGQYLPVKEFGMRMGVMNTPYIENYEDVWEYRFIEKSPVDRLGWDSSSDIGIAFLGNFGNNVAEYYFMGRNGEGYQNPELDSGKAGHFRLSLSPFQKSEYSRHLQLIASYRFDRKSREDPQTDSQLVDLLLSYKVIFNEGWGFNLAAGYDWLLTDSDSADTDPITGTIIHGFSSIYFPFGLAIFARLDYTDPDMKNDKQTHGYQDETLFLVTGAGISPVDGVGIALDIKRTSYTAQVKNNDGKSVTKTPDTVLYFHTKFEF
jgi:hypothetical protein